MRPWSGLVLGMVIACNAAREEPPPVALPSDAATLERAGPVVVEAEPPVQAGLAPSPEPSRAPEPAFPGPDDVPPTHFEGREIAPPMGYLGASWLTRRERDAEENTSLLHQTLRVQPGQTACDVGAGNGYHTVRLARAVGPTGRVLAVDVEPAMLELLRDLVEKEGLHNVETIEGRPGNPRLPEGACDLILLVDVYHELAWPEPMLAAFRRALSPQGRLALVEFRAEDPEVPIKKLHKMSKAQIEREFSPRGFVLVESFDELPWQHLLFYSRDDRGRDDRARDDAQ